MEKTMKQSNKYHKILSLFKRNMEGDKKFLIGEWTTPELDFLKDIDWVWTEKVDGTNIRVMWNGKEVVFGGRSDEAQIHTALLMRLQELFMRMEPRQKFAEVFGIEEQDTVLYGEGFGAGIQKGGGNYMSDKQDFVLFDVSINGLCLERENVEDIASKFGLQIVPIIGHGTLEEAIVARLRIELLTRRGERIITKVKHKDFQ